MKIAAGIEYCGRCYSGWQRQDHANSVQEEVERALGFVANHPVTITCAGRTDTGVHALQQVIHFETDAVRAPHAWIFGGNVNLPQDISLLWAVQVPAGFHARYTAVSRCYRYIILNSRARPGLLTGLLTWEYRPLDVGLMAAGAGFLIGEHDFTSYRARACQARSPVRNITRLEVFRRDDYVILEIEANAFLHHMVRNIAGVLLAIGHGSKRPEWAGELLRIRDRTLGGVTAPAAGLYLAHVTYPREYDLPQSSRWPVFLDP